MRLATLTALLALPLSTHFAFADTDFSQAANAPAMIDVSDAPGYDFGSLAAGASVDKTFTLSNVGGTVANDMGGSGLSAPFSFKGGSYPGAGGTCAMSLAPAASCTIVVTVQPQRIGSYMSTLNFTYNDGQGAQTTTRTIEAASVPPASLTLSDGPVYRFGRVKRGGSKDKTFVLTNTGGFSALSIEGSGLAAPFSFKGGSFPGVGGTCSATLAAGSFCSIVVTFAPSARGIFNASLALNYYDGAESEAGTRLITGQGR